MKARPGFIMALLLAMTFTLATWLEPQATRASQREDSGGMLTKMLGDSRRLFANHFFIKADVYFHSGYYPSIFEQAQRAPINSKHMTEEHHHDGNHDSQEEEQHEKSMDFLGQPRDWIDRFGRHFYPSSHSHLEKPGEAKEILPWLRLSAELDPKRVDTYIVASYWLRKHLGKPAEAEQFLREGLQANPSSYDIMYELGLLFYENRHEPARARNLWEAGLRYWHEQEAKGAKPDELVCDELLAHLARVEEDLGDQAKARDYLRQEVKYSPAPEAIKKHIQELDEKPKSNSLKQ
jgi:tetratricopeptide (TPR) repeat protein